MSNSEDHITYMKKKEEKTIRLFDEQMLNKGRTFENINNLTGTISDFDSKKPMTIKPNTNSTQQSKNTKDQSTHKDNIQTQDPVEDSDEEVWE